MPRHIDMTERVSWKKNALSPAGRPLASWPQNNFNEILTAANPNLRAPALPAANRILIIDDNETIHADFRKILGPAATSDEPLRQSESLLFGAPADATPVAPPVYHIDSATQGETGLRLVEAALSEGRPYALAFIDVRMPPGWDGIETAGRIWQVSPELPVVICTAYSDYSWWK